MASSTGVPDPISHDRVGQEGVLITGCRVEGPLIVQVKVAAAACSTALSDRGLSHLYFNPLYDGLGAAACKAQGGLPVQNKTDKVNGTNAPFFIILDAPDDLSAVSHRLRNFTCTIPVERSSNQKPSLHAGIEELSCFPRDPILEFGSFSAFAMPFSSFALPYP